ncbi:glutamate--cysteine ligase [Reinekea blandensis]|uniref:glutamate--cysteine ligase n=1 Tax=Reinekea blandensis TaxID=374838 RepID=UPI0002F331C2|nr:glutamate--cysteine ligase [Reinekea blandensis]
MPVISRLEQFKQLQQNAFVFQRGIERETLRVDPKGHISQTPHPAGLGSALTHKAITTDYSEALLEFITSVKTDKKALLQELDELHRYSFSKMDNEMFWAGSMPSVLPEQEQIPIAQYGNSHIGRLKTIYRHGLWHRYGRKMQTIAGLHYNWSLTEDFWQQWAMVNGKLGDLTPFKTEEYFGLIRNFRRHSWLLLYLFGSSPAADRSFLDEPSDELALLGNDTLYNPYATSLRMSDLGYSNQAQAELFVCFNSLETYAKTLSEAIQQPYPAYESIGLKEGDDYKQLNTSILQIENEYYSDIRPKRVAYSGEKPLHALRYRGVEYIEVRCMDVNPFQPLGIDETAINFLDLFLLWCLVQDSPMISPEECEQLQRNTEAVAIGGRDPELTLTLKGETIAVPELAQNFVESICQFAKFIDQKNGTDCYARSCEAQMLKVQNPELTPSAQVLNAVREAGSYRQFTLAQSEAFANHFNDALRPDRLAPWQEETDLSVWRAKNIENSQQGSFDDFLTEYLRQ